MMTAQEFRSEVVRISLKGVDKQPDAWITFNDILHTRILEGKIYSNSIINLLINELPVLECNLKTSYLLVTTERIISIIGNSYDEVFLGDIDRFTDDNSADNFTRNADGRYPKINIFTLKKYNGTKLSYKIESYYPANFLMILISNMISYKSSGEWFLNPR